jgi:cell division transport system permease protein
MFKSALRNIRRSPYQAISAILVLSLNLFVIAIFLLVSFAAQIILTHFETRPQVIAYLKDNVSSNEINELVGIITATGEIKDIKFVSKEEALKIYRQSVGNDPLLLGSVTDLGEVTADILPASLEISAKNSASFEPVVKILENAKIVSSTPQGQKEIDFPKDIINELSRWTKAIRTGGIVLILVLTITSIITIGTIISLKISTRRLEINTMKLIGAKNSFILKPFLWETIIYSLIASFVGWLATFITLLYSTPFLAGRLSGIIAFPISPLILIYLYVVILTLSLLLGLFSGIFASIRFLRK